MSFALKPDANLRYFYCFELRQNRRQLFEVGQMNELPGGRCQELVSIIKALWSSNAHLAIEDQWYV